LIRNVAKRIVAGVSQFSPPSSAPGRPRSEQARRAVLDAALAQFEKQGYAGATIEAIAARSGVAKTTIYRWWPNRAALLVDVLVEMASELVPAPQGGDPMRAMRAELRGIAGAIRGPLGSLLTSLLGDAQQDPLVRSALIGRLFHPRSQATAGNISRAQAAGALRSDVSPDLVTDLLVGPLFYRMFVQHQPVTDAFVQQVLQYVLEGLRPGPRAKRGGGR
jgi:AcrR family transcriptional regulator